MNISRPSRLSFSKPKKQGSLVRMKTMRAPPELDLPSLAAARGHDVDHGRELLGEAVVLKGRPARDVGGPGEVRGNQDGVVMHRVLVLFDLLDQLFPLQPVDGQPRVSAILPHEFANPLVVKRGCFPQLPQQFEFFHSINPTYHF